MRRYVVVVLASLLSVFSASGLTIAASSPALPPPAHHNPHGYWTLVLTRSIRPGFNEVELCPSAMAASDYRAVYVAQISPPQSGQEIQGSWAYEEYANDGNQKSDNENFDTRHVVTIVYPDALRGVNDRIIDADVSGPVGTTIRIYQWLRQGQRSSSHPSVYCR